MPRPASRPRPSRAILPAMDPKQLLAEALQLPPEERAAIAGELIQSLDSHVDDDAEAAWSAEIRRRLEWLASRPAESGRRQPGRRTSTGHAGSCCVGFRTA